MGESPISWKTRQSISNPWVAGPFVCHWSRGEQHCSLCSWGQGNLQGRKKETFIWKEFYLFIYSAKPQRLGLPKGCPTEWLTINITARVVKTGLYPTSYEMQTSREQFNLQSEGWIALEVLHMSSGVFPRCRRVSVGAVKCMQAAEFLYVPRLPGGRETTNQAAFSTPFPKAYSQQLTFRGILRTTFFPPEVALKGKSL